MVRGASVAGMRLVAGDAVLELDPERGGTFARLAVGGLDLLLTPDDDPGGTHWGSFVMAPWAGRTRQGRFTFDGVERTLPITAAPHAIHGTVRDRSWQVVDAGTDHATLAIDLDVGLDDRWPFAGRITHAIELHADRLDLRLEASVADHADGGAMPVSMGWHPWFRRHLDDRAVAIDLPAAAMLERDAEGIATDQRVPVPPGPWDDCFADITWPVTLTWPGVATVAIGSSCPVVVVYDEPETAVCVEPQTGPPDALNRHPDVARPGAPVIATTTWRWAVGPG